MPGLGQAVLLHQAAGRLLGRKIATRNAKDDGAAGPGLVVQGDDLGRGHADAVPSHVPIIRGNVCDEDAVARALNLLDRPPEAVIHLAAWIQVGESVQRPEQYQQINAVGTQAVTQGCLDAGVPSLVLASSAAVLATKADGHFFAEDADVGPESPYGSSKLAAERTLAAATQTGRISATALRLFNVAGAASQCAERHEPETHIIPLALRASFGLSPPLQLYGLDWPTPDGTCLRDYVHVEDVAEAMIRAAGWGVRQTAQGDAAFSLVHVGTGRSTSVLEVIEAVARVTGRPVPYVALPRRPGDTAALVCNPLKLQALFGISPDANLQRMVRDACQALRLGA